MKVAIIGCGYAGRIVAARLIARGNPVRATTTTETKLVSLASLGVEPVLARVDREEALASTMVGAESVVYLAPPVSGESPEETARRVAAACPSSVNSFVYGSTTGVYGRLPNPDEWVDETTPPREQSDRGRARLATEHAFRAAGLPLKVVRIAGIYGPGRTLHESIRRGELILFDGGPKTSRIHVEDLARILEAMTAPTAPPLVLAADDEPAATLDVARYTCQLMGMTPPVPVPLEDAKRVMSAAALELRLGGHRCRSVVRPKLIGALTYPTYREGIRQALEAEGVLGPGD